MDKNVNECNQEAVLLKKALDWELSLDSRDLRSHAWYHGSISRQQSEKIVEKEGDFLVRDCASQPGNYVLTCRSNSALLHFVINKVILQPETVYERIQYQFEDDAYDTLADLITFYVGSGKVISAASNARIQFPCNRKIALCLYGHKYNENLSNTMQSSGSINSLRSRSISNADLNVEPYGQDHDNYNIMTSNSVSQKPVLASFSKKFRSQSLTATQIVNNKKYSSADGIVRGEKTSTGDYHISSQNSLNDNNTQIENSKHGNTPQKLRHFGTQQLSELVRDITLDSLNPYHASGSDSGNGSGDSVQSSATGDPISDITHRGVVIKNPQYMIRSASSILLKYNYDFDVITAEHKLYAMETPTIEQNSKFDLENFHTLLLPAIENKPLDNGALGSIHMMLTESGPRVIAQHMSRIDYNLILGTIDKQASDNDTDEMNDVLKCSGIELLTLPHGEIFRNDLIERTECLKLLVAVTILTCKTELDRATILDKWIQIALETKTALGNLFGFSSIMMGICMPQIQKLETTWHTLRQKFTESAFTFEAKLKPCFYNMNDCSNPQAPNTTIPHLLPYILLKDRNIEDNLPLNSFENLKNTPLISTCITSWESKAEDFGLTILYSHLDATRNFTKNLPTYKRNANAILQDLNIRFDELLNDSFRTEFHIKFLWGSNSYTIPAIERHAKLEHVLTLMADKFCNLNQMISVG